MKSIYTTSWGAEASVGPRLCSRQVAPTKFYLPVTQVPPCQRNHVSHW